MGGQVVRPRQGFARWRESLSTMMTVAGLAGVGWCGHSTHWTFQWGHAAEHASAETVHTHTAEVEKVTAGYHAPQSTMAPDGAYHIEFASEAAVERAGIKTAPVQEHYLAQEVTATGKLSYDDRLVAQLSPRVAGTVWRVEKHLGDVVGKGDILAVVEAEAIGRMKAEFLNAMVTLDAQKEAHAKLESVKDSIPGRQLREALATLREARIRLLNAEQALMNVGLPIDHAEYASLSDEERCSRIRVLGLPAELTQNLDSSRMSSNLVPLLAPFEGVVISREAVVGEVVDPDKRVFEIADTSRMWVTLDISKEDVARVAPGQVMRFRPDGVESELSSRIDWLSTEIDEATRTLKVRAQVENPILIGSNRVLRAQTFGTGRIVVRENDVARVVPRESVQWDGQKYVMFVQKSPTQFAGVPVKVGMRDRHFIEIEDSLPVGTLVAVEGCHQLKSQWQFSRMETASR